MRWFATNPPRSTATTPHTPALTTRTPDLPACNPDPIPRGRVMPTCNSDLNSCRKYMTTCSPDHIPCRQAVPSRNADPNPRRQDVPIDRNALTIDISPPLIRREPVASIPKPARAAMSVCALFRDIENGVRERKESPGYLRVQTPQINSRQPFELFHGPASGLHLSRGKF